MSSLHRLIIINGCIDKFLDCLVYKYPCVQQVVLDAILCRLNTVNMAAFKRNVDHVPAAIPKIPTKPLRLMMAHFASFINIMCYFDEQGYIVVIKKVMGDNQLLMPGGQ
ncbi:hypothetical protein MAM1_0128c06045 [Mucor ambiguus]|uniref:Uncharacterized protein n=1 Tax=Mucor ambiguus TaxID=91626 RepID=A0A0C9LVD0_9FUNG|nr:hypothetical protein MAM1_0128c06045 [Mucor ambiguus]